MPEIGYYEKRPRPEHRRFLTGYLTSRSNISNITTVDDFRIVIERNRQATVYVYLTNQYTLGVADVIEILEAAPETTSIVSTMDYNQYTAEAKRYAREREVGLFRSKEFLGAVHYDGSAFIDYVSPERREGHRGQDGS